MAMLPPEDRPRIVLVVLQLEATVLTAASPATALGVPSRPMVTQLS